MKHILLLSFFVNMTLSSCSTGDQNEESFEEAKLIQLVELPSDLTSIPRSKFEPLLAMIGDAPLIGITEATHGMNEPLDFRNELIKFLVTEKRIDVVAIESGILESRLVFDYVNGGDGDIDTVLKNGFMPGFNELPQNRTLIKWLRDYNSNTSNKHKVKFYGFDIPGIPTNPWNEDIGIPLHETLNYLKSVDSEKWAIYSTKLSSYFEYLHLNPLPEDDSKEYMDLSDSSKDQLTAIIDEMVMLFESKKSEYSKHSSKEDFNWGYRAMKCTKQIDDFLLAMRQEDDYSYNVRERAMLNNLDWIMNREADKNVLLFAHLAHLAKDISLIDENNIDTRSRNLFGEYLGHKFGKEYLVIGNFFEKLDYPRDTVHVSPEGLEPKFERDKCQNYYMKLDKSDSTFNRSWKYGLRSDATNWYMNPAKGVDIILYTKSQSFFE